MTRRFVGSDDYHAGEKHMVITANGKAANPPLAVVCHGTAADGHYYTTPYRRRDLDYLAATGFVVAAADLGNPNKPDDWNNDTSRARVSELITWCGTTFGCRTDRVVIFGDSAGGATALGWAWTHTSQTAAVVLRAGVCDIGGIYQDGNGNPLLVSLINSAYDNAWPAAAATHDPALNTTALQPLKDRIRCYYAQNDGLIPQAQTIAFANAVGCRAIPLGGMDHIDTDIYPAIDARATTQWIWDRYTS